MKSPITGKEMRLVKELTEMQFRRDVFQIMYHSYLCEDSGEQFTDDQLDNINIIQVHNLYREKHGVPNPEQIVKIRNKYGVSASKMSEILGLGTNAYRLYENGDMPTVANGRLILSIEQPEEFIKQVKASSHILAEKEVVKLINKATEVEKEEQNKSVWDLLLVNKYLDVNIPNEFSGYRKPDLDRTSQLIAFFFNENIDLFKTKLNKLLFYSDFCNYKTTGTSMTGITYRAAPHGPVPTDYDKLFIKFCDDKKIDIDQILFNNGNFGEVIISKEKFKHELFSEVELDILQNIVKRFKGLTTKEVEDISHTERGWIENEKHRNLISYQKYAYDLKGVEN